MKLKMGKKLAKSKPAKKPEQPSEPRHEEPRDEGNSWDCTVCTYRNSAEAFKCHMCDVRKGTSTRKPHINLELVAQQVVRQQQNLMLKISTSSSDSLSNGKPPKDNCHEKSVKKTKEKDSNSSKEIRSEAIPANVETPIESGKNSEKEAKSGKETGSGKLKNSSGKQNRSQNKETKSKSGQTKGSSTGESTRKRTHSPSERNEPGPSRDVFAKEPKTKKSKKLRAKSTCTDAISSPKDKSLPTNPLPLSQKPTPQNSPSVSSRAREGLGKKVKKSEKTGVKNVIVCSSSAAITVNSVTVIITEFVKQPEKKKTANISRKTKKDH